MTDSPVSTPEKKRILTGDRPTGRLHLGHYVGSLQNRAALQDQYDTILIIADLHMLTTKSEPEHINKVSDNARGMVMDYIGAGIDPTKVTIYLQSAIPEVPQISLLMSHLVTVNRLTRLPSIKDMARDAQISEESIPLALISYPLLQSADILMPKAHLVPVGKDNVAHVEITREIARRFNQTYGEVFPIPDVMVSETPSLVGLDGGAKMSKSLGNCIFLSDDSKTVAKKVNSMFTDPNRIRADIPGKVEGNPVFIYHDIFNPNKDQVEELKTRYRAGKVGDTEVKGLLTEAIEGFLTPIRERTAEAEAKTGYVDEVIAEGTEKVRAIAQNTLKDMRKAMGLTGVFNRIRRGAENRAKKLAKAQA
ncbi:MAG: tryptophan--tRNA ligase [Rhodospirillaceae bacterium]